MLTETYAFLFFLEFYTNADAFYDNLLIRMESRVKFPSNPGSLVFFS